MNEKFWLGVWCDVNTTVSTLSLSRRRHSACRGLSLFLPRPNSRSLVPELVIFVGRAAGTRPSRSLPGSLLSSGWGTPSSSTEDTRSIARNYTHTPRRRGPPPWAGKLTHARTCVHVCARAAAGAFALANFRTPKISIAGSSFRPSASVGILTEYEQQQL